MGKGNAGQLTFSKAIPLAGIDGQSLLDNFDFINLKNGQTQITAAKSDFASGGASSIKAGNVQLFNSGAGNSNSTISYRSGTGQQFFSTPTADTSQTVSVGTKGGAGTLKLTQSAVTGNQTLANKLYSLNTGQWLLIGGAVAAGFLLFKVLK